MGNFDLLCYYETEIYSRRHPKEMGIKSSDAMTQTSTHHGYIQELRHCQKYVMEKKMTSGYQMYK